MTQTQVAKKLTKTARIRAMVAKHPNFSAKEIAKRVGADVSLVYEARKLEREALSTGAKIPEVAKHQPNKIQVVKAENTPEVKAITAIKYSDKYTKTVDLIAEYKLNFNLGSAVAHIFRANSDNKQSDIKAAIWYLTNELLTTAE